MKGIAILGTGPAGLMAAHACSLSGRPFSLFSVPGQDGAVHPSRIGGAQFIHKPVPLLVEEENPDFEVTYELRGTKEGYEEKVYGYNPWVPFVSYSNVSNGEVQPAWNLRRIYYAMWEVIAGEGSSVNAEALDARTMVDWMEHDMWDFVVSTIPRYHLCLSHAGLNPSPHNFMSQDAWLLNGDHANTPENTIVYNGADSPSWYRASNLQGFQSAEWAAPGAVPPLEEHDRKSLIHVKKPIVHGCDCWNHEPRLVFAGRFGKWQKGILVHDGFTTAAQALMDRGWL